MRRCDMPRPSNYWCFLEAFSKKRQSRSDLAPLLVGLSVRVHKTSQRHQRPFGVFGSGDFACFMTEEQQQDESVEQTQRRQTNAAENQRNTLDKEKK